MFGFGLVSYFVHAFPRIYKTDLNAFYGVILVWAGLIYPRIFRGLNRVLIGFVLALLS
jgi:hypothetical protein